MPSKKKKKTKEVKEYKDASTQTIDKTEIIEDVRPIRKQPEKRNELEIKPKQIKCFCNPCSFKFKSKTHMKSSETKGNEILTEAEEKTYNFAFGSSQITPETATPNTINTISSMRRAVSD